MLLSILILSTATGVELQMNLARLKYRGFGGSELLRLSEHKFMIILSNPDRSLSPNCWLIPGGKPALEPA